MADETVPTVPTVSAKISMVKGSEVLLQVILGYVLSWVSMKLAAKLGMPIDLAAQNQVVVAATILISGFLNGAWNWITHKWPATDVSKKIITKALGDSSNV